MIKMPRLHNMKHICNNFIFENFKALVYKLSFELACWEFIGQQTQFWINLSSVCSLCCMIIFSIYNAFKNVTSSNTTVIYKGNVFEARYFDLLKNLGKEFWLKSTNRQQIVNIKATVKNFAIRTERNEFFSVKKSQLKMVETNLTSRH